MTADLTRLARLVAALALLGFLVLAGGRLLDEVKALIIR